MSLAVCASALSIARRTSRGRLSVGIAIVSLTGVGVIPDLHQGPSIGIIGLLDSLLRSLGCSQDAGPARDRREMLA